MEIGCACDCSAHTVFLKELLESLLVESVVDIGVPLESRLIDRTVPPASRCRVLLVAHVIVVHPGELASFPAEVTLIPGHVEGAEEEKSVGDQRELVNVSHLNWVLSLDHSCFRLSVCANC